MLSFKHKNFFASLLILLFSNIFIAFSLNAQVPAISSFSPTNAKPGTTVTIIGSNFNATDTGNIVYFGSVKANVTNATANALIVTVPLGATYGPITVFNKITKLAVMSNAHFTPTYYPSKGSITSSDFSAKVDITTSKSYPYTIVIGDFDGDGKPDLAMPIGGVNYVSIYRNIGSSGSLTASSFATSVDVIVGSGPTSLVMADFDGDGKPDLACTNANTTTLSVIRNTSTLGNISFSAKVDFTIGSGAFGLATGDLDGDGKMDLVSANTGNGFNSISILRNTSTSGSITASSFAVKVDFAVGANPTAVAIGDLDGDNKPELAVANGTSNTMSILRNTSTSGTIAASSFAAKVDFTTGSKPDWVTMGDLDGDGKLDLATANYNANTVSVFRNTSTNGSITSSSFAAKVDFASGASTYSVAIADLDGDGKLDMVTGNQSSSTVSVFRNTSTSGSITSSSFATKVDFASGATAAIVSLGDLDGDSRPDIVCANSSFKTFSLLRNNPQYIAPVISSFSASSATVGSSLTINGTNFSIVATDNVVFMGATKAQVTAASATSLTIAVPAGATYGPIKVTDISTGLTGISNAYFTPVFNPAKGSLNSNDIAVKVDFTAGNNPYATVIGDIDADGKPDLIAANYGSNTLSIFRNISNSSINISSFATKVDFTTGTNPDAVAIGDIDGDGKSDIVVANYGSNTISVFRNISTSGNIAFEAKVDFATGTNPASVALIDVDGNGRLDIIVANYSSNTLSVFRNTTLLSSSISASSFAAKVDFTTGTNPDLVVTGDLDGDGKPDLAVTNYTSNTVSVFRNTSTSGTITFVAKVDFATGTNPRSIVMGDLDGDGKRDLAVANFTAGTMSLFKNVSTSGSITTASFTAKVDFATGANPYSIAISDFDGDGKADLSTANSGSNSISIFRNSSTSGSITTASFTAKVDFATGTSPYTISIGDLDSDGKGDFVTANKTANSISVLRNNPQYPPVINSFSPTIATSGSTISVYGHYFTGTVAVSIGGVTATSFTVLNDSTITAIVGNGATGNISVTNVGGNTTKSGFSFCVPTSSNTTYAACDSYLWNGVTYNTSGVYSKSGFINTTGCDSTAILNLTINKSTSSLTNLSVCDSIVWNGQVYKTSGTFTKTFSSGNSKGCDSTAVLNLTIKPNYTITATAGINGFISSIGNTVVCGGNNSPVYTITPTPGYYIADVLIDGSSFGGITTYTFTNVTSNHTISVEFTASCSPTTSNTTASSCVSYLWNGNTYTSSGIYTVHLINSCGLDSAATLNLIINQPSNSVTNMTICGSQLPYIWNGLVFNSDGSQTVHLTNALGCDSAATLHLTINAATSSTSNISICPSALPYSWNGLMFSAAGSQTAHLTNSKGCDSAATLNLSVGNTTSSSTTILNCGSYSWNGVTYTTSGTYNKLFTGAGGCDSIATLNLTIVNSLPSIAGANAGCVGSTTTLSNAISGGVWFTQAISQATINAATGLLTAKNAGTITIQYSKAGCGSVTKIFTINPTPVVPTITYASGTTSNPQAGAPTGGFCVGKVFTVVGTPNIPAGVWSATGATSITSGGQVSINSAGVGSIKYTYTSAAGCSNSRTMSGNGYSCAARGVNTVDHQPSTVNDFVMYPNPAKNFINLQVDKLIGTGSIIVTDLYGKTVKTQSLSIGTNTVNISNLNKGIYFVSTITSDGKTTKKLVVE